MGITSGIYTLQDQWPNVLSVCLLMKLFSIQLVAKDANGTPGLSWMEDIGVGYVISGRDQDEKNYSNLRQPMRHSIV